MPSKSKKLNLPSGKYKTVFGTGTVQISSPAKNHVGRPKRIEVVDDDDDDGAVVELSVEKEVSGEKGSGSLSGTTFEQLQDSNTNAGNSSEYETDSHDDDEDALAYKAREGKRAFSDNHAKTFHWVKKHPSDPKRAICDPCSIVLGKETSIDSKMCGMRAHAKSKKHIACLERLNKKLMSREISAQQNIQVGMASLYNLGFHAKVAQFSTIFAILYGGRAMTEIDALLELHQFLRVPNLTQEHWSMTSAWGMAEALGEVISARTKQALFFAEFFSISMDDSTANDTTQWISMHAYIVEDFVRKPLFLRIAKFEEAANATNITAKALAILKECGDLNEDLISQRLMTLGCDGAAVLLGQKTGVGITLTSMYAPFMTTNHCQNHRLALASKCLSSTGLVGAVEDMVKHVYNYFSKSPSRLNDLLGLAESEQIDALRPLRSVETRWISLEKPAARLLHMYPAVLAKMHNDATEDMIAEAMGIRDRMLYLENILGLALVQPLLGTLQAMSKVFQQREIYLLDMKDAKDFSLSEISRRYINEGTSFLEVDFPHFHELAYGDESRLQWKGNRAELLEYAAADGLKLEVTSRLSGTGARRILRGTPVDNDSLLVAIETMKSQAKVAAQAVSAAITDRFPPDEVLDACSIIYLQYWKANPTTADLKQRVQKLIKLYGTPKVLLSSGKSVDPPLDASKLKEQLGTFENLMRSNVPGVVASLEKDPKLSKTPTTVLWRQVTQGTIIPKAISEYVRVAKLALCMVGGSVEEERAFSAMNFLKNDLRNRLDGHLDLCMRLFTQDRFTIRSFPYEEAYKIWEAAAKRRMIS